MSGPVLQSYFQGALGDIFWSVAISALAPRPLSSRRQEARPYLVHIHSNNDRGCGIGLSATVQGVVTEASTSVTRGHVFPQKAGHINVLMIVHLYLRLIFHPATLPFPYAALSPIDSLYIRGWCSFI